MIAGVLALILVTGSDAEDQWIVYVVIAFAILAPIVLGLIWRAVDRRR
jgi:hypothetical protein